MNRLHKPRTDEKQDFKEKESDRDKEKNENIDKKGGRQKEREKERLRDVMFAIATHCWWCKQSAAIPWSDSS